MKKMLICALHLPPFVDPKEMVASSRPSKFTKYVPDLGRQHIVLTARLPMERVIVEDPQIANVHHISVLESMLVFNRFMPNLVLEEYGRRELTSESSMFLNEAVHEDL